jgi:hypothetical protein
MLETMMGVAARAGHLRTRPGPGDPAMRKARVCYDHLAGEMGVKLFDRLVGARHIAMREVELRLTRTGAQFVGDFGIDLESVSGGRRPLCRGCLDWSMRREHLGGALGAALLERIYALNWAERAKNGRTVIFTPRGERHFGQVFRTIF